MYKKALASRKVNVQVSFPLETNINSERNIHQVAVRVWGHCHVILGTAARAGILNLSLGGEMDAD